MKATRKKRLLLLIPAEYWVVMALILVGGVLRLAQIGIASLWYDEAFSFLAGQLAPAQLLNDTIRDPHPPFYYLLVHGWFRLLPTNELTGRWLSVFCNLLLIPVGYALGRQLLKEKRAALVVAVLITLSPFHILYSQQLRMYTLLMLLTTLAAYAYLRARHTGRSGWWFLFALFALAAIYTHLFAAFLFMAIGIHALIHYRQATALRNTILIGLLLILAFLPWVLIIAGETEHEIGSLRPLLGRDQDGVPNPIKPIIVLTFLLFGQSDSLWYSAGALFLTLSILAVFLMDTWKARSGEGHCSRVLLPSLAVLTTIGIPVFIYLIRPFRLPERAMSSASPFLLVLLAWGVTRKRSPLPYLVYASVLVMGIGAILYLAEESGKPPYREAIYLVAANRQEGDVVAHTSDGSYLPALSYVSFPQHVLLEGDPDMRKPASAYRALGAEIWTREQIMSADTRLWLIVALEHSLAWQQAQQAYFDRHFPRLSTYDVGGIQIYLYDLAERNGE